MKAKGGGVPPPVNAYWAKFQAEVDILVAEQEGWERARAARAVSLSKVVCNHLSTIDTRDGLRCSCDTWSWQRPSHHTSVTYPWWTVDVESAVCGLLLVLTFVGVIAALVVGQR